MGGHRYASDRDRRSSSHDPICWGPPSGVATGHFTAMQVKDRKRGSSTGIWLDWRRARGRCSHAGSTETGSGVSSGTR